MADKYDIAAAFQRIENELTESMIRNLKRHRAEEDEKEILWSQWQVEQLAALERYKKNNQKKYKKEFRSINARIEALIKLAYENGNMEQEAEILEAIKNGFKGYRRANSALRGDFFQINERKLDALIKATVDDMEKAETAILRMADDKYRQIIFDAQVYANTGAGTYEKAVDMASKDFLSAGLNCIMYANGARHTLSDYADMAIQTAAKRAYLQGEGTMREEWGIHTVIMNKRSCPCPKCLPFVGKVLIDDVWSGGSEKDGPYPLMSTAIAAGLYHPRCRDIHTTYFPGISTADDTWTKEELAAVEKHNKQTAKMQYAERQERKFERLSKYSLDEENKRYYSNKHAYWKHEAHNKKYPLNEEVFETYARPREDGLNIDMIRPRNIIKELEKNEIGQRAYSHIKQNGIEVNLLYNMDNPYKEYGAYDPVDKRIIVYVDETKTIQETTKTIIHEATHDRLGHKGTRKEEVLCFMEEARFDGKKLTYAEIKSIIKAVNNVKEYRSLPWR